MLDAKNMEKLAQLKAELIAEEPKPEVIYPFKSSAKTVPDWDKVRTDFEDNLNRYKSPPIKSSAPIMDDPSKKKSKANDDNAPHGKKHHHKHKHKSKPNYAAKINSCVNGGSSSAFRKKNRQMVASHSNIARSYYSGEGNSLYTYSGGDVRPK